MPLITLLRPNDQARIVNSLLTIYKHDGYLPDGRSGNCNGRTQSGSNAEIVIADAFVKGLEGIDWELAAFDKTDALWLEKIAACIVWPAILLTLRGR